MKKVLTIVVPTYNTEKYLGRCLDSLVFDNKILNLIEIIIVNDGSKDNSLSIAREYEKKYSKSIIVIDKENGGHGSTINAAIKIATGKYFKVLDSDDWVNVEDFSKFVNDLKELETDIVLTNYSRELIFTGEEINFTYPEELKYNYEYDLNKFDFDILKDTYFFMATSTYKTKILQDINLYLDEKTYYVDMEYNAFPINNINTMIYLNYDIYKYYIGRPGQSINLNSFIKNRKDHEKVLRRLLDFLKNGKLKANKKKYVIKILLLLLNTHYGIYCKTPINDKKLQKLMKKEIKEFDSYIKENHDDVYKILLQRYPYIEFSSMTKFRHAVKKNYWFMRFMLKMRSKKVS